MSISTALKNKLKSDIAEGNIIYTPTAPFTYNLWTGMVYIVFDPVTGSGNYVIGEGLNGGYTVEAFPAGWSNFWRTYLIPGLTATIIKPTNNQEFTIGDLIPWKAVYTSPLNSWEENLNLNLLNPKVGTNILKSGYGTNTSVNVVMKAANKLGLAPNDIDKTIIDVAHNVSTPTYTMSPSLLKSILAKESGLNPKSYRYEPCYDKNRVSFRSDISEKFLKDQPYLHYALPGKNGYGVTISEGNQVNSIKVNGILTSVKDFFTSYSKFPLIVKDSDDADNIITAYDIWKLNNDIQNYSSTQGGNCILTEVSGNFTPQFLISASYGLGQVMYPTAVEEGFDSETNTISTTARNLGDLIDSTEIITRSVKKFINSYISATGAITLPTSCEPGGRIWNALLTYNGGGNPSYPTLPCQWYKNGTYGTY